MDTLNQKRGSLDEMPITDHTERGQFHRPRCGQQRKKSIGRTRLRSSVGVSLICFLSWPLQYVFLNFNHFH